MPLETLNSHELNSQIIQHIGIDFDGTLIDTMGEAPEVFAQHVENEFGVPFKDGSAHFINTLGTPTDDQIRSLLRMKGIKIPSFYSFSVANAIDNHLASIPGKLFPEVRDVLEELTYEGFNLFITTSHTPDAIRKRLIEYELTDYFPLAIGKLPQYKEITKGKPHFKLAARHFGIAYEDFVPRLATIGDSINDVKLSHEAGALTFAVAGTHSDSQLLKAGAIAVLGNLREFPKILKNL